MIRMGRSSSSSKTEQSNETPQYQQQPATSGNVYGGYQQETAQQAQQTRGAMTESESIARDIKDGRLSGYVGAGTTLTGETNFQAMLRVDGHLTGRVISDNGLLVVGSGGQVDADILVSAATIGGTVNGDIVATEKVELGRTARVIGNIQTPRLMIEDGAIFEGNCSMLKAKESLERRAEEARQAQYVANDYPVETSPAAYEEVTAGEEASEAAAS
jgi:cytoskeletal protein CcmA (bactofilin family)